MKQNNISMTLSRLTTLSRFNSNHSKTLFTCTLHFIILSHFSYLCERVSSQLYLFPVSDDILERIYNRQPIFFWKIDKKLLQDCFRLIEIGNSFEWVGIRQYWCKSCGSSPDEYSMAWMMVVSHLYLITLLWRSCKKCNFFCFLYRNYDLYM